MIDRLGAVMSAKDFDAEAFKDRQRADSNAVSSAISCRRQYLAW
jgi:hypothetical protein